MLYSLLSIADENTNKRSRTVSKTALQQHVEKWKDCTRCDLSANRQKVVIGRGSLPCDLLFIGEAPGDSENIVGKPFVGPAGRLLDYMIEKVLKRFPEEKMRVAITNLVGCIPKTEEGEKFTGLLIEEECIKACGVRVAEFVEMAQPKLMIFVGKLATDWLTPGYKHSIKLPTKEDGKVIPYESITHPSALLRLDITRQEMAIRSNIVKVIEAVEDMITTNAFQSILNTEES